MHRFICDPANVKDKEIVISDKGELHHMFSVLRLAPGDAVALLDGRGGKYFCKISKREESQARFEIIERIITDKENVRTKLTVACAWLMKDKMNFVVEKLTELATERIILIETERTGIKPSDVGQRIEKLRLTSVQALKQSGALFLPVIEHMTFSQMLGIAKDFDLALLPNLEEESLTIRAVLNKFLSGNILAAIGPEGDFSKGEIERAKKAGFVSVSLGDTVLKVETAAIVVAGFVRLRTLLLGKES